MQDLGGAVGFVLKHGKLGTLDRELEFQFVLFSFYCNLRKATSNPGRFGKM
jgi:hypothetical protein